VPSIESAPKVQYNLYSYNFMQYMLIPLYPPSLWLLKIQHMETRAEFLCSRT
jgi:hypothetical protein